MEKLSSRHLGLYGAFFFVSGFCSLVYQVIWLRLAFASFGVITPVISVVLSTFMLGLALGSWLAGSWTRRSEPGDSVSKLRAYGLLEACIALGALLVPRGFLFGAHLLSDLGDAGSGEYLLFSAIAIAVTLLPWCICMGATFPVMLSAIRSRYPDEEQAFSYLYKANVFGATTGALAAALVLVELFGFSSTGHIAALMNLGIAIVSFAVASKSTGTMAAPAIARPVSLAPVSPEKVAFANLVLFWTGFTCLGMEVAWTRGFTRVLSTTIYSFATILAIYLFATWAGTDLYRLHLSRRRTVEPLTLFGALILTSFFPILLNDPRLPMNAAMIFLSMLPFCALLGYLTPLILDSCCQGSPSLIGRAYSINLAGGILGPLVTGYLLLPYLGVKQSLFVLALPYLWLWWSASRHPDFVSSNPKSLARSAIPVFGMAAGAFALFGSVSLEDGGYEDYAKVEIRRDSTATVVSAGQGMDKTLIVNGVGMTFLTPITKFMAHLPLTHLSSPPKELLTLCFGMGTAYRSMLQWGPDTTVVELVKSVPDAFQFYFSDADQVRGLSHGRIVIDDGRRFVNRTTKMFDVITIDPPPPMEAAGVSLLYSTEFMQLLRSRLRPDGILQHWVPPSDAVTTRAVFRSVTNTFPHVRIFKSIENWGHHILASSSPIPIRTPAELVALMPERAKTDLMEWYPDREITELWADMLGRELQLEDLLDPDPDLEIRDDRPINEYQFLRTTIARWDGTFSVMR